MGFISSKHIRNAGTNIV